MLHFNKEKYQELINRNSQIYIKKSITKAKLIDKELLERYHGEISTKEGIVKMVLGDYLATDTTESEFWLISAISVKNNKEVIGNEKGWLLLKSKKPVRAMQMDQQFEVMVNNDSQIGKSGDYLVHNGYAFWAVDREIFERDYDKVD